MGKMASSGTLFLGAVQTITLEKVSGQNPRQQVGLSECGFSDPIPSFRKSLFLRRSWTTEHVKIPRLDPTIPARIAAFIDRTHLTASNGGRIVGTTLGWWGVNVTNQDTRRRLLISRHIAKMTPEEIARRFTVSYTAPMGTVKQPRARTRAVNNITRP
jgi:hypothetical protein